MVKRRRVVAVLSTSNSPALVPALAPLLPLATAAAPCAPAACPLLLRGRHLAGDADLLLARQQGANLAGARAWPASRSQPARAAPLPTAAQPPCSWRRLLTAHHALRPWPRRAACSPTTRSLPTLPPPRPCTPRRGGAGGGGGAWRRVRQGPAAGPAPRLCRRRGPARHVPQVSAAPLAAPTCPAASSAGRRDAQEQAGRSRRRARTPHYRRQPPTLAHPPPPTPHPPCPRRRRLPPALPAPCSSPRALAVLPSAAAVAEVRQLERCSAGIEDVDCFLRDLGLVVQVRRRDTAVLWVLGWARRCRCAWGWGLLCCGCWGGRGGARWCALLF